MTVQNSALLLTRQGYISTIRLNNPPYNPIGAAQVRALEKMLPELAADRSVRVIVIRGAGGKNFSVGANLKEGELALEAGVKDFLGQRIKLFTLIETVEKPVVAAIEGYCLGGGLEMAMACHYRVAATNAQLSLPEIDLGAAPMWGGVQRLTRLVGRAHALELILSGRKISGEEAKGMRLVHQVYEENSFERQLQELANELADKPPLAVAAIIRVLNRGQEMTLADGLAYELEQISALAGTKDNIEGVSAMFEKRKPKFIGE